MRWDCGDTVEDETVIASPVCLDHLVLQIRRTGDQTVHGAPARLKRADLARVLMETRPDRPAISERISVALFSFFLFFFPRIVCFSKMAPRRIAHCLQETVRVGADPTVKMMSCAPSRGFVALASLV